MARILVAEDEDDLARFIRQALQRHGHDVTAVADGATAARVLSAAPFDLLVSDIVMPVMDGIALALKAEQEFPDLRIILITGFAREERRAHNLDLLIDEILPKPFTADELVSVVDRVLTGGTGGSPSAALS